MRLHPKLVLEYENNPRKEHRLKIIRFGDLESAIFLDKYNIDPLEAFKLARFVFDAVCQSYNELLESNQENKSNESVT